MSAGIDRTLVTDIARVVVAEVAPAELPTFRAVSEAYFADPARSLAGDRDRGPLQIGEAEVVVLVTPVALAVATEVTRYLFEEAIRPAVVKSGSAVRRLFGARGAADHPEERPVELTAEQWARVREIVVDVVSRCGGDADTAQIMADAVVGAGQRPKTPEPR
ncbi:hypothetical protein NE236_00980 [Actinoallomurus purpureus]|uniref:hypothetical protein n=1 Tax=Actinoallomurus purpureus TaxID=478114 RepID=UPI0020937AE5|nr:hypothetical protein [Actinoallomurus purpureus]MCO6003551.1 hypothetical protein [Actinoallomurus purpureus]